MDRFLAGKNRIFYTDHAAVIFVKNRFGGKDGSGGRVRRLWQ